MNVSVCLNSVCASYLFSFSYSQTSNLILGHPQFQYVQNNKIISLSNSECGFSYRNSSLRDKPYIIYNIDFDINRSKSLNLKYESIKNYIKNNKLDASKLSLIDTSKIIINIRNSI